MVKIFLMIILVICLGWGITNLEPRDRSKHWTNDPFGWVVSLSGIALMLAIATL